MIFMSRTPQRNTDKKTLLHCQERSGDCFSFCIASFLKTLQSEAKADTNTVWQPNEVWRLFSRSWQKMTGILTARLATGRLLPGD